MDPSGAGAKQNLGIPLSAAEQQEVEQLAHLLPRSQWRMTQEVSQAFAGINQLGSPTVMCSWSSSVETWMWGLPQGWGLRARGPDGSPGFKTGQDLWWEPGAC